MRGPRDYRLSRRYCKQHRASDSPSLNAASSTAFSLDPKPGVGSRELDHLLRKYHLNMTRMREKRMTLIYSCKSGLYYEAPVLPVVLRASIAWEVSITSMNSKPNLLMLAYAASYSHSYFLDQIVHLKTFCAEICSKSVFRSMVPIPRWMLLVQLGFLEPHHTSY